MLALPTLLKRGERDKECAGARRRSRARWRPSPKPLHPSSFASSETPPHITPFPQLQSLDGIEAPHGSPSDLVGGEALAQAGHLMYVVVVCCRPVLRLHLQPPLIHNALFTAPLSAPQYVTDEIIGGIRPNPLNERTKVRAIQTAPSSPLCTFLFFTDSLFSCPPV